MPISREASYPLLSRQVAKDLGIEKKTSKEAILIAARRFKDKIKKEAVQEKEISKLLKNTEFEIKTKTIVVVIEKTLFPDGLIELEKEIKKQKGLFHAVEGVKAITIITSEKYLGEIKKTFKHNVLKVMTGMVSIILQSTPEIETTPGVMAYLYGLIGGNGINIYETLSCWTDTIFVIKEEDLGKVMDVLKF